MPSASRVSAQDSGALQARLQAAQQNSSLEDAKLQPWHLKLTVHLFDPKGKPSGDGTIEEWWSAPDHDRREYTSPDYKATEVRDGDKQYRTKDAGTPPYLLAVLREQAVNPVANYLKEDPSHAELRKQTLGKTSFDCIMLSQPIKRVASAPLGLFPTYCMETGKDEVRVSFEFGNQLIVHNSVGHFQGKTVATKVSVNSGPTTVAQSEIVTLETLPANSPSPTSPPNDLVEQNLRTVRVSSATVAGRAISRPNPEYPVDARMNHIDGTVVMHAVIGTDGHIHSLRIVSAPDPTLAISAISAVRQWTYQPYLLMGVPVDVETTINVNYSFGH